ncbi:MAG: TolC family protein [Kofleriaceae bacterium]|nr:TolC family protein [Kofleriaceae bacterium]
MTRARCACGALSLALVTSCVPALPKSRAWTSDEVAQRTGSPLRSGRDHTFVLPPSVRAGAPLSTREAVAIAVWNNPGFQAELAQLVTAHGDLADAAVLPNPVATLLFPWGPKQLELTVRQGLGALWQRPKRVTAARKDAERIAETLVQRSLDIARDTELAYAELARTEQLVQLAREAEEIWRGLAAIAEARLRTGDASNRERDTTRADALSAHDAVAQALTDAELARSALRTLLGAPPDFALALAPQPPPSVTGELATWLRVAGEARPDLRAARLAVEAAGARAGLERDRLVELTAMFDLNGNNAQDQPEAGPGIELPIPIFDQRQGGRMRAAAELERTGWTYVAVRRQIQREVVDAHARLVRASAALARWRSEILVARTEAHRLTLKAFERGEESHLVVLEMARALVDARRRVADLEAEQRRADAELARAAGGRPRAP